MLVHIDGLHRLQSTWDYDEYLIAGQVYHGTRPVGHTVLSRPVPVQNSYYKRVLFDVWLVLKKNSSSLTKSCDVLFIATCFHVLHVFIPGLTLTPYQSICCPVKLVLC